MLPERRLSLQCYHEGLCSRRHVFSNRLRKMNMKKNRPNTTNRCLSTIHAARHHTEAVKHPEAGDHEKSGSSRTLITRPLSSRAAGMRNTRRTTRNRTEGERARVSCPRVSGNPSTWVVGSIGSLATQPHHTIKPTLPAGLRSVLRIIMSRGSRRLTDGNFAPMPYKGLAPRVSLDVRCLGAPAVAGI